MEHLTARCHRIEPQLVPVRPYGEEDSGFFGVRAKNQFTARRQYATAYYLVAGSQWVLVKN